MLVLLGLAGGGCYFWARARARSYLVHHGEHHRLQALPVYYALRACLWCVFPALVVVVSWLIVGDELLTALLLKDMPALFAGMTMEARELLLDTIRDVVEQHALITDERPEVRFAAARLAQLQHYSEQLRSVSFLVVLLAGTCWGVHLVQPQIKARLHVERTLYYFLALCALVSVLSTVGIVGTVLFQAMRFFDAVPIGDFLFGLDWHPQIALREGQIASQGAFGVAPLIVGTVLISLVAMFVAIPVGLMSAVYLSEYASAKTRALVKPIMEILAGIPTVVYGFFAALTVAPLLTRGGDWAGVVVSPESALAAGLVMGVMTIPFVSSLSDDVINAVPQALRESGYGLGATRSEVVRHIVLPAALPGVAGSILLAVSRAIGETMIVVMAAGLTARLTINPLESVTTITTQIVSLLVGDQAFDDPKTLAAFALGLFLFVVTLTLNVWALWIVRRYREQYE